LAIKLNIWIIPDHADSAVPVVWQVERYDALIANFYKLVRPDPGLNRPLNGNIVDLP
jgi:hypothetical protein